MPKIILSALLGFLGLTLVLSLIMAVSPQLADGVKSYVDWTQDIGQNCIAHRDDRDQPGPC